MHPDDTTINEYVDETLDPRGRATVASHLESCASCRVLVEDLREIRRATSALELREPPIRAWRRIERAIALESESRRSTENPQNAAHGHGLRSRNVLRSASWWVAVAAAMVLATVVGLRFGPAARRAAAPGAQPGETGPIATGETPQLVETELRQAETHYENAIKGLEQIASAGQSALDPGTAATLQKNLAVIDQAISESRAAVRTQPDSEPAQESLLDNFKTKIGLLQNTVALINEMRKGNEAGAARIVSGLKPKGT
jgi:Putative zinc-finger